MRSRSKIAGGFGTSVFRWTMSTFAVHSVDITSYDNSSLILRRVSIASHPPQIDRPSPLLGRDTSSGQSRTARNGLRFALSRTVQVTFLRIHSSRHRHHGKPYEERAHFLWIVDPRGGLRRLYQGQQRGRRQQLAELEQLLEAAAGVSAGAASGSDAMAGAEGAGTHLQSGSETYAVGKARGVPRIGPKQVETTTSLARQSRHHHGVWGD
jgi:hypothetical protein